VLPVTIVMTPMVAGMWQVTKDGSLRAELAAQTERDFATFLQEQAKAAGMDVGSSSETSTPTEAGPLPSGAPPE
jgi:hypothetical protein